MILVLIYQCLAGFLAWWNYILIKNNKRIYHALNGALHIAAALLIGYFTKWNYGISCLLFTRVVFDGVLNALRPEKSLGYVPEKPISITDRVEAWIIFEIVKVVYKRRISITEDRVERVAIWFRLFILGLAFGFLVI